jgi:hypothetical protein
MTNVIADLLPETQNGLAIAAAIAVDGAIVKAQLAALHGCY